MTLEIIGIKKRLFPLDGRNRLFADVHEQDAELFYILKGTAEYNDNGEMRIVHAGDVTICPTGTCHGIANKTDEVVELVAVIVYA